MSDLDDPIEEFWSLFGAELDEYLAAIESILAASPVDPARVDELFRAFHSVKGGSAALALRCIETVAHAAEDVLHLVRAGKATLTTDLVSALLEAVDEMRRLQDTAMATRTDQPVNGAIVARLKTHLTGGPVAAAPVAPASLAAAPVAAPVPTATLSAPERAPALTVDASALEAIQDAVLGLIGAIDAEDPGDAALALADAAEPAELHGIVGAALRLAGGAAGRWGWLDLVLRLRGVESASGQSVGAFALSAALEALFADLLLEHAGALKSTPEDPAVWLHAARLFVGLEVEAGAELADLIAARLLRGEEPPDVDDLADLCALTGISVSSGMEIPRDEITALRDRWLGAEGVVAEDAPVASPVEHAHAWPADTLMRMAAAEAGGDALLLVLLDLEHDPAAAEAVTERLRVERCLYNRSRLDLRGGMFEYVVAVRGDPTGFARELAELDPGRACLRSIHRTNASAAPGDEIGGAPASVAPVPPPVSAPASPALEAAPPVASAPVASAAAAPSAPAASPGAPRPADAMVRVPSAAIDGFMDVIGELRLGLTSLSLSLGEEGARPTNPAARATYDEMRRLDRAVRQLYEGAIALRVVPIGTLFTRLLRPIRDTAVLVGKEVALTTAGEDVQVDKAMIEMLVDPLTHIVRNSVDHGVESPDRRAAAGKPAQGSIRIRARQTASLAIVEVEDDGGGIDVARVRDKAVAKGLIGAAAAAALSDGEALNLILLPGFSTRDEVTATSGRGVGMDIVLTAIKKLGGHLAIDSRPGLGTRMTIEFPVSAAMQRVLTAEVAGQLVAIHERSVREVVDVTPDRLRRIGRRLSLSLRGRFLPVVDLGALLGLRPPSLEDPVGRRSVVVADDGHAQIGLMIDRLAVRREVFFKRLHPLIEGNTLIAGAAVIGAGSVMFALDTPALFARAVDWLEPPPHPNPDRRSGEREDPCSAV
ncbi:chemotaxis protein CheW [Azospirillum sp.]|uniref:chemotaxis protein CheA n=1 Tax=Azospirillum sp. TaxID=34012 RepID=UPI00260D15AF|nr:chemotaxis protein CheW [Azospirillum sp.]